MRRISRVRDEKGLTYVFVALGFMAFLGASMLAIDVGMIMTARGQSQNAADAGALAGATALVYDDWNDRSATGPAVKNALAAGQQNQVMGAAPSVTVPDVVFLPNPTTGEQNRVQVTVQRSSARGNPLPTFIATYFRMPTVNVGAVATAEASPANAMTCVKPFTIPDRWRESTGTFDPNTSTFDPNADTYIGPDDAANYTGYNAERDKGTEIVLKASNDTKIYPSFYYPYDIPGRVGASDYRADIGGCNNTLMHFGDTYNPEPGNMVGPTQQGMSDLLAMDPSAYWDTSTNSVHSSMHPSPRIVAIPLFDPYYYWTGKQNGRNASLKFVNYMGFFIEDMRGNQVVGRITPIGGLRDGSGGPAPAGAFPRSIRLVQ